jgi:hypothetical protein
LTQEQAIRPTDAVKAEAEQDARPAGASAQKRTPRRWVCGVAWVSLGAVLGLGGYHAWTQHEQHRRLTQARGEMGAVFAALAPGVEARLEKSSRRLDDLEKALDWAPAADRSDLIELPRYRVQQRRLEMQAEEVAGMLRHLAFLGQQARRSFSLGAGDEVLTKADRDRLDELQAQFEELRDGLKRAGRQMDLAGERRTQLVMAENEAGERSRAEADALPQAQEAGLHVAQAETGSQARFEPGPEPRGEPPPQSWAQSWDNGLAQTPLPVIRYVRAVPLRYGGPLIIGSRYPDRFIGYRSYCCFGPPPLLLCRAPLFLPCW